MFSARMLHPTWLSGYTSANRVEIAVSSSSAASNETPGFILPTMGYMRVALENR